MLTNIYGCPWLVLKDMLRMIYFAILFSRCCTFPCLIIAVNHKFHECHFLKSKPSHIIESMELKCWAKFPGDCKVTCSMNSLRISRGGNMNDNNKFMDHIVISTLTNEQSSLFNLDRWTWTRQSIWADSIRAFHIAAFILMI